MATLPNGPASGRSRLLTNLAWLGCWCLAAAGMQALQIGGDAVASRSAGLAALVAMRLLASAFGGLLQGWILRWRLPRLALGRWVLFTGVGSGLALLLVNALWAATQQPVADDALGMLLPPSSWIPMPLLLALSGGIVAALQLPVLRRCLSGAAGWPAVGALAALMQEAAAALLRSLLAPIGLPVQVSAGNPLHWLLSALAGALAALLTGAFLLWRRPDGPSLSS